MKNLRRAASIVVTVIVLLAPAAPASASEVCDGLPDLSQYGWQWPC